MCFASQDSACYRESLSTIHLAFDSVLTLSTTNNEVLTVYQIMKIISSVGVERF